MFQKFNFPKENNHSFTVLIENQLADAWEEQLAEVYGDPIINGQSDGRQWYHENYSFENKSAKITIHLWNTPKSSNQSKF